MRIAIHDYAGHAFPLQLARQLARRGHEVLHLWSSSLLTNPSAANDPSLTSGSFQSVALDLGRPVDKRNYLRLALEDEPAHSRMLVEKLEEFHPGIILSGNCSPQINHEIIGYCRSSEAKFVAWVQDLYGKATARILPSKFPIIGHAMAAFMEASERKMLNRADGMVLIAEEFYDHVPATNSPVAVIQNWAPLEELPQYPKVNPWSTAHGLEETTNFIYSGTIGMKHNPDLLVEIAKITKPIQACELVVISAGRGVEYLQRQKEEFGLENLILLPYQPFS
ncbi:hypothetical protein QPK87_09605, partial [Kamptonema cortianum]|nr:hypothetical protein [Kamptonema cortianum]